MYTYIYIYVIISWLTIINHMKHYSLTIFSVIKCYQPPLPSGKLT